MDLLTWLDKLGINYSLSKCVGGFLFTLENVSLTNGLLTIKDPCMLARTPENALNLFLISYDGFNFLNSKTIISVDNLFVKKIPKIIDKNN